MSNVISLGIPPVRIIRVLLFVAFENVFTGWEMYYLLWHQKRMLFLMKTQCWRNYLRILLVLLFFFYFILVSLWNIYMVLSY